MLLTDFFFAGVCYDKYVLQSLHLETATLRADMKKFEDLLSKRFQYQFPYKPQKRDDYFVNPRRLIDQMNEFLCSFPFDVPGFSTAAFLLYFHGHGALILDKQCIITNEGTYIPVDELVDLIHKYSKAERIYVVMDCCSNIPELTDPQAEDRKTKGEKRVRDKVISIRRDANFDDKVVRINAVPRGYEAPATSGKTFTDALVTVLEDPKRPGAEDGAGVALESLQDMIASVFPHNPKVVFNSKTGTFFPY